MGSFGFNNQYPKIRKKIGFIQYIIMSWGMISKNKALFSTGQMHQFFPPVLLLPAPPTSRCSACPLSLSAPGGFLFSPGNVAKRLKKAHRPGRSAKRGRSTGPGRFTEIPALRILLTLITSAGMMRFENGAYLPGSEKAGLYKKQTTNRCNNNYVSYY
jgi:hypothetical protein